MSVYAGRTHTAHEEQAQGVLSRSSALFELIPGRVNRAFRSIGNRLENFKAGRLRVMRIFVEQVESKIRAIKRLRDDLQALMKRPGQLRRRTRQQIRDLLVRVEAYQEAARAKVSTVRKELRYLEKQLRVQPGSLTNPEKDEALIRAKEKAAQDRKRAAIESIVDKAEQFEGKTLEEVMSEIAKEQKAIDAQIEEDDFQDEERLRKAGVVFSDEDAVEAALKRDDVDALVDALAMKSRRPVVEEKDETSEVMSEFGSELKKDAVSVARGVLRGYRFFKRGLGALAHRAQDIVLDNTKSLRALKRSIAKRQRRLHREQHVVRSTPQLRTYVHGKMRRAIEASLDGYRTLKRRIKKGSKRIVRGTTHGVVSGLHATWQGVKNLPGVIKDQLRFHSYHVPKKAIETEGLPHFADEVRADTKATVAKLRGHARRLSKKANELGGAGAALAHRALEKVRRRIFKLTHGTDVRATPEMYRKTTQTIDAALTSVYQTARDIVYGIKKAIKSLISTLSTLVIKTGSVAKVSARSAASSITRGIDTARHAVSHGAKQVTSGVGGAVTAGVKKVVGTAKATTQGVVTVSQHAGTTTFGWLKRMGSALVSRVKATYVSVGTRLWELGITFSQAVLRIKEKVFAEVKRGIDHIVGAYARLRGDVKDLGSAVAQEVSQLPEKIKPRKKKPYRPLRKAVLPLKTEQNKKPVKQKPAVEEAPVVAEPKKV